MQLNQFTDYSLRALIYLGTHPGRLSKIAQIADAYDISVNHLMKIVNRLASRGYVETIRGKGGGLRLARAPELINIGEVVRAMEERFDIVECFSAKHQDCPLLPNCALKKVLSAASRNFLATLDAYTLANVIGATAAKVLVGPNSKGTPARGRKSAVSAAR
jgi:Rrf2 family nitric oxide-sensitive transcriptional repressor